MTVEESRRDIWTCDLCGARLPIEQGDAPPDWIKVKGKDVCDECVSEILHKKNAWCR